jgi:hypothetical protein
MREAAADIDAGGTIAALFAGVPTPPGSFPVLRLLAALHYLVLCDDARPLAELYPAPSPGSALDAWEPRRSAGTAGLVRRSRPSAHVECHDLTAADGVLQMD